jgi:hypothetical protein
MEAAGIEHVGFKSYQQHLPLAVINLRPKRNGSVASVRDRSTLPNRYVTGPDRPLLTKWHRMEAVMANDNLGSWLRMMSPEDNPRGTGGKTRQPE